LLFKYKSNARVIFEFGCATAPIMTSLFEFHPSAKNYKVYISDVKTISFHYAAYKFRQFANVIPILLSTENAFLPILPEPVDVIFCITVFEHLFGPLAVIKTFHQLLAPGGLLFFDYIKAAGDGLDTKQGVEERDAVLDYMSQNFNVLSGAISKDKSMGLTIIQKK
jgi:SAM-dependent methyltransferase